MVSGNQQPTVEQDQSELAELRGAPKLTPRSPRNPPVHPMAPMPASKDDDAPELTAGETVLQRRLALTSQEGMAFEIARREWLQRGRADDEARHRAGVARMLEAERRSRERRDQEDEERRRR
jgi:hypothetical protein